MTPREQLEAGLMALNYAPAVMRRDCKFAEWHHFGKQEIAVVGPHGLLMLLTPDDKARVATADERRAIVAAGETGIQHETK